MAFTKRHYEEVARIIKAAKEKTRYTGEPQYFDRAPYEALEGVQAELRRMFAADNPRFDGTRFDMACEPREGAK